MTSSITFLVVALALALGLYQIFRALRLFKKPNLLKNHAAGVYELPEDERNRVFGGRDPEEVVSVEVLKTVLKTGKVPVLKETPVMALPTITRSRLQMLMVFGWGAALVLLYIYLLLNPSALDIDPIIFHTFSVALVLILAGAGLNAVAMLRVVLIHYWIAERCIEAGLRSPKTSPPRRRKRSASAADSFPGSKTRPRRSFSRGGVFVGHAVRDQRRTTRSGHLRIRPRCAWRSSRGRPT